MPVPIKDLKKLAAVCRKAGITNLKVFQDGSYEFALDPTTIPQKATKRTTKEAPVSDNSAIEIEDALTEEQLLFYSVADTQEQSQ